MTLKLSQKITNNKNVMLSGKIGDLIFGINSPLNSNKKRSYYQGGISTLPSIMNYLMEKCDKKSEITDINKNIKTVKV